MNLLISIQHLLADYLFRKEFKSGTRDVIVNNIDAVSNVGIIFFADNEESYRIVTKFSILLKKEGVKEVKMLGFLNQKELPSFLTPKLDQDFFLKKDLNWHLKPGSVPVTNFVREPFDILIDLTITDIFPLKYILGKSRAHFKVGKGNSGKNELLDLMINTADDKGLEDLTKDILHYLRQINKVDGDVLAMLK